MRGSNEATSVVVCVIASAAADNGICEAYFGIQLGLCSHSFMMVAVVEGKQSS